MYALPRRYLFVIVVIVFIALLLVLYRGWNAETIQNISKKGKEVFRVSEKIQIDVQKMNHYSFNNGDIFYSNNKSPITKILDATNLMAANYEQFYHNYTMTNNSHCSHPKHFGREGDGGWDLCLVGPFLPVRPCYSFSFGVGNIWEFDDQVATELKCEVFTFDPSMNMQSHKRHSGVRFYPWGVAGNVGTIGPDKWPVWPYSHIISKFSAQDKIIDILKMDVEYSEWDALGEAIKEGLLTNVKQLLLETHTFELNRGKFSGIHRYRSYLHLFQQLYELGFRKWKAHWNPYGEFKSLYSSKRKFSCCHESHFINVNFLEPGNKQRNDENAHPLIYPQEEFETNVKNEVIKQKTLPSQPQIVKVLKKLDKPNYSLPVKELEKLYYNTVQTDTASCKIFQRIGDSGDGGWDVCMSSPFAINKSKKCTVYDFGINFIYKFDDHLAKQFGCRVRMFDPSMKGVNNHKRNPQEWFYSYGLGSSDKTDSNGWKLYKYSTLLKKFNESTTVIDILKIDIEHSEWDSLDAAIEDGVLHNVKQLMFETHTEELLAQTTAVNHFQRYLKLWHSLYNLGFRQWKHHINVWNHFNSKHTGTRRPCCHEHYFVNINYIK